MHRHIHRPPDSLLLSWLLGTARSATDLQYVPTGKPECLPSPQSLEQNCHFEQRVLLTLSAGVFLELRCDRKCLSSDIFLNNESQTSATMLLGLISWDSTVNPRLNKERGREGGRIPLIYRETDKSSFPSAESKPAAFSGKRMTPLASHNTALYSAHSHFVCGRVADCSRRCAFHTQICSP